MRHHRVRYHRDRLIREHESAMTFDDFVRSSPQTAAEPKTARGRKPCNDAYEVEEG